MAKFVYEEGEFGGVRIQAESGEEIPLEIARTHALLDIGDNLAFIARAINGLAEEVRDFNSLRVELEK